MELDKLQKIYNLVAKYHKDKWLIKTEKTVLGKNFTVIHYLTSPLNYSYDDYEIEFQEIKADKPTTKFFDEVAALFGIGFENSEYISDITYDIENDLDKEWREFSDMKLTRDYKNYINSVFYKVGKLQPWKVVEKTYDPNMQVKTTSIKLSNDYTAILTKGKPVEVGCQWIPIDTIRKVVEAYDKL